MSRRTSGLDRGRASATGSHPACWRCSRPGARSRACAAASASACTVRGVGHVAGHRRPPSVRGASRATAASSRSDPAGVDHERPAPLGQCFGEGEAESLRGAGDHGARLASGIRRCGAWVLLGSRYKEQASTCSLCRAEEDPGSYLRGPVEQVPRAPDPGEAQPERSQGVLDPAECGLHRLGVGAGAAPRRTARRSRRRSTTSPDTSSNRATIARCDIGTIDGAVAEAQAPVVVEEGRQLVSARRATVTARVTSSRSRSGLPDPVLELAPLPRRWIGGSDDEDTGDPPPLELLTRDSLLRPPDDRDVDDDGRIELEGMDKDTGRVMPPGRPRSARPGRLPEELGDRMRTPWVRASGRDDHGREQAAVPPGSHDAKQRWSATGAQTGEPDLGRGCALSEQGFAPRQCRDDDADREYGEE